MKYVLSIVALLLLSNTTGFAQQVDEQPTNNPMIIGEPPSEEDAKIIAAVMDDLNSAWGSEDIDALMHVYWDDAEWTNAFGRTIWGHDDLGVFLTDLFEMFDMSTTQDEGSRGSNISTRYLTDDIVIIHNQTVSRRGDSVSGEGPRHIHITYVLHKRGDEWKIVHQMIMDARS